jgi:hypothetical protein
MQSPRPRNISIALIVFVLTPYGEVTTVTAAPVDLDELLQSQHKPPHGGPRSVASPVPAGASPFSHFSARLRERLCDTLRARVPSLEVTARLHPLMPRLLADGAVCIPLWTAGRISDDADLRSDRGLAELARAIGDPTIEADAEAEFRRRLASDPIAHQMVGESTRLRAVASDEALRQISPDEVPPIFALLPGVFTIDQLRLAAAPMALAAGTELERSSNFRRRVNEFIEQGVLADCGEAVGAAHRGRPPRLYRFDAAGWEEWLHRRSLGHRPDDDGVREDMAPREDRVTEYRERMPRIEPSFPPSAPPMGRPDDAIYSRSEEPNRPDLHRRRLARQVRYELPWSEREGVRPREPRVDELERQVERLSGEVQAGREQMSELLRMLGAELRARRSGDEEPRR